MRLQFEPFLRHLKGKLAPIYLIEGAEILMVEEALDALHLALKTQGFSERLSMTVDAHFNVADLNGLSQNFSLFAEKKRLQLNCHDKIPSELQSWILAYCKELAAYPDLCLILKMPKLAGAEKKTKWYLALEHAGVVLTIPPLSLQDFPRWLESRLGQAGIKLSAEARSALITQTEGNLLATSQIIKKLALVSSDQPLHLSEIEPLLSENARYDLFDLSRQVLLGDLKRALSIFEYLRYELEGVLVLWVLSKELKTLLILQTQKGKKPQAELYRSLQIWDKRIQEVEAALRRLPATKVADLLAFCAEIDLACKGLSAEDPWALLKQLILKMSR